MWTSLKLINFTTFVMFYEIYNALLYSESFCLLSLLRRETRLGHPLMIEFISVEHIYPTPSQRERCDRSFNLKRKIFGFQSFFFFLIVCLTMAK